MTVETPIYLPWKSYHFRGCLPGLRLEGLPSRCPRGSKAKWCCWRPRMVAAGTTRRRPYSAWARGGMRNWCWGCPTWGGYPKWMVYFREHSSINGWFRGSSHISGNPHTFLSWFVTPISMVYGSYIYIYISILTVVYKQTITVGHHLVGVRIC